MTMYHTNASDEGKVRDFQNTLTDKFEKEQLYYWATINKPGQTFSPGSNTAFNIAELMIEEANELYTALMQEDVHQVLKETCDLVYTALHAPVIYNLNFSVAFNRVHHNNMLRLQNGEVNEYGRIPKPKNHPTVNLEDLV